MKNRLELLIDEFILMRKEIGKPMTKRSIKIMKNRLNRITDNDSEKEIILKQSIEKKWMGIYPLKKEEKQIEKISNTQKDLNFLADYLNSYSMNNKLLS